MNKRLIILFAILAIVVLVIVLGTVVFTVRDIDVLIASPYEDYFDEAEIIKDSKIKINTSIFALSEQLVKDNIEGANPYAKVTGIERVFPSIVRINMFKREEAIAVPLEDGQNCILLDREMRILSVVSVTDAVSGRVALLSGYVQSGVGEGDVGEYIAVDKQETYRLEYVSELILAMERYDFAGERLHAFAPDIRFDGNYLVINTAQGLKIAINYNATAGISQQFASLYSAYCTLTEYDKTSSKYLYIGADRIMLGERPS